MRRGIHLPLAVLASAACLAGAVGTAETAKRCWRPDDVAYAVMTQRICELNWALFQFGIPGYPPPSWNATAKVLGCWNLMAYNTNKYLSSGVYQSSVDNRCVLVFSGFHGALTGYLKAMAALINPPERWSMCKNQLYAPFVKVLRAHTALKNWTRIVDFIAGPKSTCAGGTATLLGESVGGSLAEIFATCSATGDLAQVQPKALPRVQVKELYTYGAMASSAFPLHNYSGVHLQKSSCFRGKRYFHSKDAISKLGNDFLLVHPHMDAVEIFDGKAKQTFLQYACRSIDATWDREVGEDKRISATTIVKSDTKVDMAAAHSIKKYVEEILQMTKQQAEQPPERHSHSMALMSMLDGI
mmetsp:Transcript_107998/g.348588  ORF Transcript_107998/g.348588 Transcript_107998/m.348588 type:complete len:356 (+) Transcript_107998:57-1124(+)